MNSAIYHILVSSLQPVVARALVIELQQGSALDTAVRTVADRLPALLPTDPARKHAQTFLDQLITATEEFGAALIAPLAGPAAPSPDATAPTAA